MTAVRRKGKSTMTLLEAEVGKTYIIKEINTDDDEMNSFLFRLGCYSGEPITVVSKKKKSCVAVIKDGFQKEKELCGCHKGWPLQS